MYGVVKISKSQFFTISIALYIIVCIAIYIYTVLKTLNSLSNNELKFIFSYKH